MAVIDVIQLMRSPEFGLLSNCCSINTSTQTKQICPECGSPSKNVGMATPYHQVRFPENQSIITELLFLPCQNMRSRVFFQCGNIIPKQYSRSHQAIENEVLYYCFDIDAGQYLSALKAQGAEPIKEFVMQRTKAGECSCGIRNPSGQCCLANFKQLEGLITRWQLRRTIERS